MLAAGQRVERYEVEEKLGQGGLAVVYRVRHLKLGTLHALKVLAVGGPTLQERLEQEGRIQARLRHPNVVAVTDVLEVGGTPALLMDYVAGPSLESWLAARGPLPFAEAERLFRAVVAGVERAHAAALVHRDLKPANVLVDDPDGAPTPKVTDFGLAKALEEEPTVLATRSGVAMGTPPYMSPEQIRDTKRVDQRTDVFALGCILYELVTGDRAFPQDDVIEIYNAISRGQWKPLERARPGTPPALALAVRGCLVVDRDARIRDCAQLRAVLDGEPGAWRPAADPSMPTVMAAPPLRPDAPAARDGARASATLGLDLDDPEPEPPLEPVAPPVPDAVVSQDTIAPPATVTPPSQPPRARDLARSTFAGEALSRPQPPATPTSRRSRRIGAVAVAAGVLVVAAWSLRGEPVPTAPPDVPAAAPGTAAAPDTRTEPVPTAAPQPPAATPTPEPATSTPEPATPTPERARSKARATASAPAAPAPAAAGPVPTAPAPTAIGTLVVNSSPWSHVELDGKPLGTTSQKLDVASGKHRVSLRTDAGDSVSRDVSVPAAGRVLFCWDFEVNAECP